MHPACQLCRGACCESMVIKLPPPAQRSDQHRWLELHGTPTQDHHVELPAPCRCLSAGRCTIHATRPQLCRDFRVGSLECLLAIQRRRPDQEDALHNLIASSDLSPLNPQLDTSSPPQSPPGDCPGTSPA